MTNEEAKHIVDVAFGIPQAVRRAGEDRTYHEKEIREAKEMAIKALERTEPQGVFYRGDGYYDGELVYDFAECPECDFEYEESDHIWGLPFCPKCGQALKWEVEDDQR